MAPRREQTTWNDDLVEDGKKNGVLPTTNGDSTDKNGDSTDKNGDLTNKNGDLTNKTGDLTKQVQCDDAKVRISH